MDREDRIHVTWHVARGDTRNKMEGMVSINTDTYNNPFCQRTSKIPGTACEVCYAMRLAQYYGKKSMAPFVRNGQLLNDELPEWKLPRLNVAYCRFHSFGELESDRHFFNLMRIAKVNPGTRFALWTKRPDLVDLNLVRENVVLVYSTLRLNQRGVIPKGFHRCFTVHTDEDRLNCEDRCFSCLKCYHRDGEPYIRERLR